MGVIAHYARRPARRQQGQDFEDSMELPTHIDRIGR
jgi:hypothetical protein